MGMPLFDEDRIISEAMHDALYEMQLPDDCDERPDRLDDEDLWDELDDVDMMNGGIFPPW